MVGETLYLVWVGDRRYRRDNREVTVTKVGRKYFEVSGESCQFFISTWMEKLSIWRSRPTSLGE